MPSSRARRDRGLELGDLVGRRARSSAARAARRRRGARTSRAAAARSGARTGRPPRSSASSTDRSRTSSGPGSSATMFQSEMPCVPSVDGQQADRVLAAARGDVREHLAQEVDDRRLAERLHLGRQLRRDRAAEALGAALAAARPALGVVDADVRRHHPRRLVPEDGVDAALEHPVGPLLAERAVARRCSGTRRRRGARRRAPGTPPGWNVTQRLSASPPNVRPSPHGLACTVRPASCEASTISRIVPR